MCTSILHVCVVCFISSVEALGTGPCGEVDELQSLSQEVWSSRPGGPDDSDVAASPASWLCEQSCLCRWQEEGSPPPRAAPGALALLVWPPRAPAYLGWATPVPAAISGVHRQAPRPGRGRSPLPAGHSPVCTPSLSINSLWSSPSHDCWLTVSPLLSS